MRLSAPSLFAAAAGGASAYAYSWYSLIVAVGVLVLMVSFVMAYITISTNRLFAHRRSIRRMIRLKMLIHHHNERYYDSGYQIEAMFRDDTIKDFEWEYARASKLARQRVEWFETHVLKPYIVKHGTVREFVEPSYEHPIFGP